MKRLTPLALLATSLFTTSLALATPPLGSAVQQELKLLEQEAQSLRAALTAATEDQKRDEATLARRLDTLTEALITLRHDNDQLSESGLQLNRLQTSPSRDALLTRTFKQLKEHLQNLSSPMAGTVETHLEQLPAAIMQITEHIANEGRLRVETGGSYFDSQGNLQRSDILWISQVAAIALNSEGGPLLPTSSTHLKLDTHLTREQRQGTVSSAHSLSQAPHPTTVGAVVFDPDFPANNLFQRDRTLWETIQSGGLVMWPILLLALCAILITLERLWNLNLVHTNAENLMIEVDELIQQGDWEQADERCEKNPGVVARVMEVILQHKDLTREQMEDRANEVILSCRPSLERFLSGLNIIAAVSPLLGLLGTVTGMIATFLVITQHGTGDPKLMAGGISEALLTTQLGLMVAIPALMAGALLNRWVEHILGDIETNSLKLLNSIEQLPLKNKKRNQVDNILPIGTWSQGTLDA